MNKNKEIQPRPFLPSVTLEQVYAFRRDRKQTHTQSEFLNAVLAAMQTVRPASGRKVAEYLDLDEKDISGALRILTGYNYTDLRHHWVLHEIERLKVDAPHLQGDPLARHLGFADRTSLWRFLQNKPRLREIKKEEPKRHADICPERR